MADITAKDVNELRKRTGLGLMECKALLKEADGDMEKSVTLAKERNLTKAAGRAGRAATAGRVEVALSGDGKSGALVELGCETDFVARNDAFRQAARDLAEHVLAEGNEGDLHAHKFRKDPSRTIKEVLTDLNVRTGENVSLSRTARFAVEGEGRVDAYVHHDGKSGALVELQGPADAALAKDVALQVVAARPMSVRREDVPAASVEEQRRIVVAQMENDPEQAKKPPQVREKIAEGKLNAWFGENALLEQVYVKDGSKKVRDVLAAGGKGVSVARFARFVVGEAPEGAGD
jgi:elongation factor Ts